MANSKSVKSTNTRSGKSKTSNVKRTNSKNITNNNIKNNKAKTNKKELEKTNSYNLVFDNDRMTDSESLDVSFIDGKKKKASKIDTTDYSKKSLDDDFIPKKSGEAFSVILIIILSFILGCLFFYILVRDELNEKVVEEKVLTETKIIVDDNYVFLGDSIFKGYDLEKYYPNMNVVNSGVSGNKTEDILENIKDRLYIYNPSKVFLMIGTNDIKDGILPEDIALNIEKIVSEIKRNRPYANVYVQSIYPINNTDDEKINHKVVANRENECIQKINNMVKTMCEEKGITYIDLYSKLVDSEGNLDVKYTVEGLHITDEGYKVITNELMKYINEY